MKSILLALLGGVSALLGLAVVPTLFYNLAGLFKMQDGADGTMWETGAVVVACLGVVFGAFFLSYRLFRSATAASSPTQ
jgi:hypothetical protein